MWKVNLNIVESDHVAKSCPVSYRTINQYGGTASRPCFSRVNLDTMGCVWSGEFDLNTLRVDGEIFESGKKKLRIQKNLDTCGRGVRKLQMRVLICTPTMQIKNQHKLFPSQPITAKVIFLVIFGSEVIMR